MGSLLMLLAAWVLRPVYFTPLCDRHRVRWESRGSGCCNSFTLLCRENVPILKLPHNERLHLEVSSALRALRGKPNPLSGLKLLWGMILNCFVGSEKGLISYDCFLHSTFSNRATQERKKNLAHLKSLPKISCHFLSSLKFLTFQDVAASSNKHLKEDPAIQWLVLRHSCPHKWWRCRDELTKLTPFSNHTTPLLSS